MIHFYPRLILGIAMIVVGFLSGIVGGAIGWWLFCVCLVVGAYFIGSDGDETK